MLSCWYPSYLTLNSCFVLVLLLLVLYLLILDFIRFALKSVNYILHQNVSSFPCFQKNAAMFKTWQVDLFTFEKATNNSSCVKIIKNITQSNNQYCLFLDLGFDFQLEFRQYKFRNWPWFFCLNKLNFLYCWNKAFFLSHSYIFPYLLQLLCQTALP